MNNQIILWSMLVVPWLSLFFMKKEDLKRYMPVGVLAVATSVIIGDVGSRLGFWIVRETAYPLYHIMPFNIGLNLALTMWVFKFSYHQFWLYMVTNAILDLSFNFFLFQVVLSSQGIFNLVNISPFQSFLITTAHALLLYGYQKWQEGIFMRSVSPASSQYLQPALAKPLPQDRAENSLKNEKDE